MTGDPRKMAVESVPAPVSAPHVTSRVPDKPPSSYARITAEAVMAAEFTGLHNALWTRHGYYENEVDDFLDRVWATLRRYEDNNYLLMGLIQQLERISPATAAIAEKMKEVITQWPSESPS